MFDKKAYLKEKIEAKLTKSDIYKSKYGENSEDLFKLIDSLNIDIMATNGETFKDCVISMVNFCNMVEELVRDHKSLTVKNIKSIFKIKNTASVVTNTKEISEEAFSEPISSEDKLKTVLEAAEHDDFTQSYDADELTEEGLRARGLIGANETSLDAVSPTTQSDIPTVKVKAGKPIISPFSGTQQIYQVDSNTYMDVETEQEFRVKYI